LDHPRLAQPNARVFLQRTTGTLRCFLTEDNTVGTGTSVAPSTGRDIAIIGLAGRYPGAKDVLTFWHLLKAGKSGIREIPQERWNWRSYFQTEKGAAGSMYTKWGGFLEDIDCFDAAFFHISPREAEQMDPQERLFLEASYACVQDAGYTPGGLR
ncbi:MAG: polyketide synthase, partial [Chloroflexi bacterium]